jgi:hypothetical protein
MTAVVKVDLCGPKKVVRVDIVDDLVIFSVFFLVFTLVYFSPITWISIEPSARLSDSKNSVLTLHRIRHFAPSVCDAC